ncbi:MAG: c-type cytochrome [Reichenbachiella sp.]
MKFINHKYIKPFLALCTILVFSTESHAQELDKVLGEDPYTVAIISMVLVVLLLVLLVAIYLLQILKTMVEKDAVKMANEKGVEYKPEPSPLATFWSGLTNAVPIEQESTVELDHNYDGIRELDNHLPPWWKWLFNITIVWGVVYMLVYHVFETMPLQDEEYEIAMEEAAAAVASSGASEVAIDESNITIATDAAILASGKTTYERNCVACHKAGGEGGIGPNLTDEFWLHGGSPLEVYNSIKNGIPDKGMIAWKDVLSPAKMNEVNSYIYTLRGTNPANAKEPQGDKYVE